MKKILVFLVMFCVGGGVFAQNPKNRQVVLQAFWWDYYNNNYPNGWANYLTELAPRLRALGIDAVWIPPTVKNPGTNSVGYVPFDHYDLGDKYQKNNVKTRLGDKDDLLRMMAVYKANGIDVIQDIILNHMSGAGAAVGGAGGADPAAMDDGYTAKFKNFRYACYRKPVVNENNIDYLSRNGRFPKNWQNFYPNGNNPCCTNDMNTPWWGPDIAYEADAFGQSSNASFNPTQSQNYMRNGMRDWIIWYKKQMGWDGVRLDAIKHFPAAVSEDYLWNLQNNAGFASGGNDMFAVGEWVGGASDLDNWCNAVQNRAGTFDFAFRNALTNIVAGQGNFDIGSVPSYQQSNRGRTVPFVNNHDTFRPILTSGGNYNGWNTTNQLGMQIEPNDPRLSVCYALIMGIDGAPCVFFEDLFNIGYNNNRFNHRPSIDSTLPVRSDIANIIWCHQNLGFAQGAYFVRWQAQDALVIERGAKALIAVNDNWSTWQDLTGVQTNFPDGTQLKDYSGACGTSVRTVYNGGKVDISIPPCNGTALQGRRGYSIWAPVGITTNYSQTKKNITQEWEMDDDLGDSHVLSLREGGRLPDSSRACRTVSRIYAAAGRPVKITLYTADTLRRVVVKMMNNSCGALDSAAGAGTFVYNFTPQTSDWYGIIIRNESDTVAGQKLWVNVNYRAPEVVNPLSTPKAICDCQGGYFTSVNTLEEDNAIKIYPNPSQDELTLGFGNQKSGMYTLEILDLSGRVVQNEIIAFYGQASHTLSLGDFRDGVYIARVTGPDTRFSTRLVRIRK